MLDLLAYAAIFAIGTVLGMYVRRQAVIDFKAGLQFGLAEATAIAQKMARWSLRGLTATKQIGLYWRNLMMGQSYEMARAIMNATPPKSTR